MGAERFSATAMQESSSNLKTPPVAADLTGRSIGRFSVQERLGAGGMGEVYRAFDTKLQRMVALKRMASREGMTPADRGLFLHEGQRASALNHPNIAAIYDVIEEQDDILLVMEYVEGSTLRSLLGEPMPVEQFFPLALQCAEALGAAHARGVLHGDVKPENIMLTPGGQVKLLDFGIARRLPGTGPYGATVSPHTLAILQSMAGTPAYMAPEVLRGEVPDARADIFALGLVLYEMLAGKHPFQGQNTTVITARILSDNEAVALRKTARRISSRLGTVVARAILKDPARRYQDIGELQQDLEAVQQGARPVYGAAVRVPRWVQYTAGPALVAVLLAALPASRTHMAQWWHAHWGAVTAPAAPRVAVLPPRIDGSGADLKAFGDGLAATVAASLSSLSQNHDIQVIDPMQLRRAAADPEQALKNVGANMTLHLEVQQAQGLNRVTYALADAKTGRTLVSRTLTAPEGDPFSLQDQVADGIIGTLRIALRPDEQAALSVHGTTDPAAYQEYLEARGYLEHLNQPGALGGAIIVLNRALAVDPNFGRALAMRGEAEWAGYEATRQRDWVEKATMDCNHSIALGNAGAEGHLCLGMVSSGTGDYQKSVDQYQKAVQLDPTDQRTYIGLANTYVLMNRPADAENAYRQAIAANPGTYLAYERLGFIYLQQAEYARAAGEFQEAIRRVPESYNDYNNLGAAFLYMGKYPEAIQTFEHSLQLHPLPGTYANVGTAYFHQRKFADAARYYEKAVSLDSRNGDLWGNLGDAYHFSGQQSRALDAWRKQLALINERLQVNPRDAEQQGDAASCYADLGDKADAEAHLAQSLALGRTNTNLLFNAAVVYNDLGETGDALEWLHKALAAGYSASIVRDSPDFDNLRSSPQFQALLRGAGGH